MDSEQAAAAGKGQIARRATFAGLAASLVGIGLARFAYTPLIPALIDAGWFSASDAVYLGAANLAGYLAGALLARGMAARRPAAQVLRSMMLLATASFFVSAWPQAFLWYTLWRFASGYAGGALMVLAAPSVLPLVPAGRRGLAGGIVFTGVGLGIAASGILVPPLLRLGLVETWCALGGLSLALTLLSWRGWPNEPRSAQALPGSALRRTLSDPLLARLFVAYGLCAVGLVPAMVFLVDYVARGLGQGLEAGALVWVAFGVGALIGPLAAGRLADGIGFRWALRLGFAVQAAATAVLALAEQPAVLLIASALVGAFVPGVVPLVVGRVHELVMGDGQERTAAWSLATTAFALGQAAGAYGLSYLFEASDSHRLLFALGAGALALALALDLVTGQTARGSAKGSSVQASGIRTFRGDARARE